jgi:putative iron-regulated protein
MSRLIYACLMAAALTASPIVGARLGAATPDAVVENYADIAQAVYEDSLATAGVLQAAVRALIATPTPETLEAAKTAWRAARVPYQQTEAYRFGNPVVDEWEGRVNAWPLDEGLIDYVQGAAPGGENPLAALNVIATPRFTLSGTEVDASEITPDLISGVLHEADGIESNVASGYHAIEFLLWGQDLNGTGPGAGKRPFTDYIQGDGCTNGNCDRRAAYLQAATDLLVQDLTEMVANWGPDGAARAAIKADPVAGLKAMLTGMGSLSYGELAGERMRLGLMLNDPEEEHDCFSDNTHNSHYHNGIGIQNVYLGTYIRTDGTPINGASLGDLVAAVDPALDGQIQEDLTASIAALGAIKEAGDAGFTYDQMIAPGNQRGEVLIMAAVDVLVAQTRSIERVVAALGVGAITVEGSDSLDNPDAVFE